MNPSSPAPRSNHCMSQQQNNASIRVFPCCCADPASQTVEVQDLSPSGLLLMRVFFHEIIATDDDASFMEVCTTKLTNYVTFSSSRTNQILILPYAWPP